MRDKFVSNFLDYSNSLNEGNSFKKELGVLGPFEEWGYKIKTSCPEYGGDLSPGLILASGMGEDSDEVCLKYVYGEDKESDSIYLPKSCMSVSGSSKNPILQTKNGVRWWESESNQEILDDFINSFIESKHFSGPEEETCQEDLETILDLLGIESSVVNLEKKKDFHWLGKLEDGMEIEMKKKDENDFLKNLKLYLNSDSYSPEVEIYRDSPGYEAVFLTPKGKFIRKTKKLTDFSSDPINKYLFSSSMKKDPSLYQEPVVNYLNSILKAHDWRPASKKNQEEVANSEKEILRIKKILLNTIPEADLDEIYSKAREMYSPGKPNS